MLLIGEQTISVVLASKRIASSTKMIRRLFLGITEKNTGSLEVGNGVDQVEKGKFGQALLNNGLLSTWPFLQRFMEWWKGHAAGSYSIFNVRHL